MPHLTASPAVVDYSHRIAGKWGWVVDYEKSDYVIVAVGEDLPDHFMRGLTAKVLRNGSVYILETDKDGEEHWRLDRAQTKSG